MKLLRFMVVLITAASVLLAAPLLSASDARLPADVRVVIDISGSMKSNDPQNLRQPALDLLIQLIPDGSKAGVWTFGQYVNMLVPHKPVDDAWRAQAKTKVSDVSSFGLYTNIGGALDKAAYDSDQPNPNYRTSVILLTDGMVDVDKSPEKNQAEWRRIVDKVLPDLRNANYTLHTIALSDNADTELMNKLALGTDGIAAVAKSADDLMKVFLKALDQATPAEQVPLEGDRFVIDSSIEEFTALIFRQDSAGFSKLVGPDKTLYSFDVERSDVNWYRTDQYDLITIQQPLEGEWLLQADVLPDSRVTVVSNLNLLVKPLKSNLFVGESSQLSLLLQEDGKTLQRAEFLRLIDVDAAVSFEDDAGDRNEVWSEDLSGSLPPGNGIYSADLDMFLAAGNYQLKVLVDGKSFKRQFEHSFSVREPFGVDLDKRIVDNGTQYLLTVSAFGDDVDLERTKIVAKIKNPSGRTAIKPLQLSAQDNWQLSITPDNDGVYTIALRINGIDKSGKKFGFDPESQSFTYPDSDDPFATATTAPELIKPEPKVKPEIVPEPKPEPKVVAPDPVKVVEEKPEPEPEIEEESDWLLYALLAGGNLVIMVVAFFAYRMIMGGKKDDSLEELEKSIEEAKKPLEEPAAKAAAKEPEPTMADVSSDTGSDESVADDLMAGVDISDDSALASDLDMSDKPEPAPEPKPEPFVEPEDDPFADMGEEEDLGFSMDDFSDLAGDDDDEKK